MTGHMGPRFRSSGRRALDAGLLVIKASCFSLKGPGTQRKEPMRQEAKETLRKSQPCFLLRQEFPVRMCLEVQILWLDPFLSG